jgi:hypothetical protein
MSNNRKAGEKPLHIYPDKAYVQMACAGDGDTDREKAQHDFLCHKWLNPGDRVYFASWKTSPRFSVHSEQCRQRFFPKVHDDR